MSLSIVLVRPKPHPESIGLQKFMISEPLELEYLSAVLEGAGHRVRIIDMILEPESRFIPMIRETDPDLVGFTAYIPHVGQVIKYARQLKDRFPRLPVVAGGVHAECNPEDFVDSAVDYVVKANGMKTMLQLATALEKGDGAGTIRRDVPGLWNGPDKPCEIETAWGDYPFPDRTKTAQYRDRYNYIFHEKCAIVKTSFGCPYKCEFCYCIAITQGNYWARPIEEVVEEMAGIEEENIFIVDDDFLVSIDRIRQFCTLMDERQIKKNFILFGRADFITEHTDTIRLLKEHGLKAIFVGIESFKEEELESYQKKTTVAMNTRAVQLLDEMGIECYSGIIVGTDWDRENFNTLIKFLKQFKMPLLNVQPITPIPGTPLYEKMKDKILVPRDKFHLWDMAHILIEPEKMSRRAFYWNMLRVYYQTSTGFKGHWYVLKNYGFRVYRHTAAGALYITWQYLKLVMKG
ncbi:MAG: cobalamin-dependent protein [Spirochaetales bacterium]|nr:cobalamin-dependent protein [Spirochaetales bacterium]